MKTIKNKTNRPLRVPLPRGRTVHLGPGKSGQIATAAAEHAGLKKLVDAGEIEILEEESGPGETGVGGQRGHASQGHSSGGVNRRSGDR